MSYPQVDFHGTINCQILTYQEVWVFRTPILDLNVELDIDKWLRAKKRQCLIKLIVIRIKCEILLSHLEFIS